jgi:DNA-binding PadR family transcriptional regulator
VAQEITQNEVQARVLEEMFDLANSSDGRADCDELAESIKLPVMRVKMALERLEKEKHVQVVAYDDPSIYTITESGYRTVEEIRLAPGHNSTIPIPASDRIVTLGDNQKAELEGSTSDLLEELGKANAVDGDELLRERFFAQLSAARELVRAQSVRAYLFYQLVVEVLAKLISTYGKTALGVAAAKLLELYVEYLVKG